jgi:hypothetical protein
MAFQRVANHPDREEIIKQLLAGSSAKEVSQWLTEKYPDSDEHHLAHTVLQHFRKTYLDLDRSTINALRREKKKKELGLPNNPNVSAFIDKGDWTEEERNQNIAKVLMSSPTYQQKLKESIGAALDGPMLLKQLTSLLQARLEVYFNEIASGTTVGDTLKADKMFAEYVSLFKDVVKDYKKVEQDYNSVPDEGTIDLDVVHKMIGVVRDTVKEMFGQIDANLALEFTDRLHTNLSVMRYEIPKTPNLVEKAERMVKQIDKIKAESRHE